MLPKLFSAPGYVLCSQQQVLPVTGTLQDLVTNPALLLQGELDPDCIRMYHQQSVLSGSSFVVSTAIGHADAVVVTARHHRITCACFL